MVRWWWCSPLLPGVVARTGGVDRARGRDNGRRSLHRRPLANTLPARTLNGILWDLDDLSSATLLAVCALRQLGVNRSEVGQHLLVHLGRVGVDRRRVLTQVVKTGECLAAVTRERTLSGVLSAAVSANEVVRNRFGKLTGRAVRGAHYA